jgi:hypothetical protein
MGVLTGLEKSDRPSGNTGFVLLSSLASASARRDTVASKILAN